AYFLASSRTKARPFWLTKSTMERRRSSFKTEVRLSAMVPAYVPSHPGQRAQQRHSVQIRSYSINSEEGTRKTNGQLLACGPPFAHPDLRSVHHHRLHQVAGPVDVEAVQYGNVISKELQRHNFHEG